jgi:hypothetical protein
MYSVQELKDKLRRRGEHLPNWVIVNRCPICDWTPKQFPAGVPVFEKKARYLTVPCTEHLGQFLDAGYEFLDPEIPQVHLAHLFRTFDIAGAGVRRGFYAGTGRGS